VRSPTISQPLSRVTCDVFGPSRVRRMRANTMRRAVAAWPFPSHPRLARSSACADRSVLSCWALEASSCSLIAARYLHHHR
jgi:hypothetical protein